MTTVRAVRAGCSDVVALGKWLRGVFVGLLMAGLGPLRLEHAGQPVNDHVQKTADHQAQQRHGAPNEFTGDHFRTPDPNERLVNTWPREYRQLDRPVRQ